MRGYTPINNKRLIQLVFCLCCLITSVTTILSQTSKTIKGNITDSMGIPIEMAVVYTKSSIDSSFIRFTNSNEKGDFTLVIPPYILTITLYINYLGYKPISHFLVIDTLIDNLVFRLTPQSNQIKEVIVKAERQRIVEQGDTLSYNLKSFRDSTEYSIEDLLRKLPGIEISPEGRIKANGKEIKTVLLEGDVFNIQNVNTPIKTLSYYINPTGRITFKYFLKLNVNNDFNLVTNQNQLSKNVNHFVNNRFSSELFYNSDNWNISLSLNHFSSSNNSKYNASLLTSSLSLRRKIVRHKKESTLHLKLYNLNFAKNYATTFSDNTFFFKNAVEAVAPFFIMKYDFSF